MTTQEQRDKRNEYMRKYREQHPQYVRKGVDAIRAKRVEDPAYGRTAPEELRRRRAEYMRIWREKNPGRQEIIDKAFAERWRKEHPEIKVGYHTWWRKQMNPESRQRSMKKQVEKRKEARAADPETFRARDRAMRHKFRGLPEAYFHDVFATSQPSAFRMDRIRPDFYVPGEGFVEIKLALPKQAYNWRQRSQHFPNLFFLYTSDGNKRWDGDQRTVDTQIALSPRPLLVLVFNPLTGEEIARQAFE